MDPLVQLHESSDLPEIYELQKIRSQRDAARCTEKPASMWVRVKTNELRVWRSWKVHESMYVGVGLELCTHSSLFKVLFKEEGGAPTDRRLYVCSIISWGPEE